MYQPQGDTHYASAQGPSSSSIQPPQPQTQYALGSPRYAGPTAGHAGGGGGAGGSGGGGGGGPQYVYTSGGVPSSGVYGGGAGALSFVPFFAGFD